MPNKKRVSRREFIKGAAVVGVGAGAGLLGAAPALAAPASQGGLPAKWDYETDVLVVGSGNGGISAAVRAAKEGVKVILIEISGITGGASSFSGGSIHNDVKTYDEYLKKCRGLQDPVLGKAFYDGYQLYKKWLLDIGAPVHVSPSLPSDPSVGFIGDLRFGTPEQYLRPPEQDRAYFDGMQDMLAKAGGTLMTKTRAVDLLTDAQGTLVGLTALVWSTSPLETNQKTINIKAKAVILATGGFECNPELVQRYFGREADLAKVAGNPYAMGDGMRMAQKLGAALSHSMGTTNASLSPARPFKDPIQDPDFWEKASFKFGPDSIASVHALWNNVPGPVGRIFVNLYGKRFYDEYAPYPGTSNALLRQPQAMAFAIFDGAMWATIKDTTNKNTGYTTQKHLDFLVQNGATVVIADTIDDLADKMSKLANPVHKANLLKTLTEYNAAVDAGKAADLEVARTSNAKKIATPPLLCNRGDSIAVDDFWRLGDQCVWPSSRLAAQAHSGAVRRSTRRRRTDGERLYWNDCRRGNLRIYLRQARGRQHRESLTDKTNRIGAKAARLSLGPSKRLDGAVQPFRPVKTLLPCRCQCFAFYR